MTREEEDLLLKDLCARLPYHPRVKVWLKDGTTEEGALDLEHNYGDVLRDAFYYNKIVEIKPYLFPLSSMTEEQEEECQQIKHSYYFDDDSFVLFDWYNKNHFDYRSLIKKELAIDATNLNIY